jgi:hypothetical protein
MPANNAQTDVVNYLVPAAGSTSMYNISQVFSATPQNVDFRATSVDQAAFTPSGVFIDNSQGTGPLTVTINEAGFSITCAAGSRLQTQYPAPMAQSAAITGLGQATVIFVDFPVIPFSWGPNGANGTVAVSNLPTIPGLPVGAAAVSASSGNVAAAVATATMPAVVGKTNYITGLEITGAGATAAAVILAALSGILGGTINYNVPVAAGVAVGNFPLVVEFNTPIPASAANTAIVLTVPSYGAGNTNSIATIHGFVL